MKELVHERIAASKWPGYVYCYPHKKAYRPVNNLNLSQIWDKSVNKLNLYVHIPFCESRCAYCNLFTLPIGRRDNKNNVGYIDNYVQSVVRQIEGYRHYFDNPKILSLYFGGGTPNYLSIDQLKKIVDALREAFPNWDNNTEPCIECSPYLLDKEYIRSLKELGFRRISMGMQSFDSNDLKTMNRCSEAKRLIEVYDLVRKAGLNTNVDIIYGLPGQDMKAMLKNLEMVMGLSPKSPNISLYPLVVRKLTGMDAIMQGRSISGDEKYEFFNEACKILEDNGYEWESSIRFVLGGSNSTYKQQLLEFEGVYTLGIGSGARSYAPQANYVQPYKIMPKPTKEIIDTFISTNFVKGIPLEAFYFNKDELRRKFITFSFLRATLDINRYKDEFGESPEESYTTEFQILNDLGLVEKKEKEIILTDKGKRYHDIVVDIFESEQVKQLKENYDLE